MRKLTHVASTTLNKYVYKVLLLMVFNFTVITQTTAVESKVEVFSVSQGQLSKTLDEQQRKRIIEESKLVLTSDQINGTAMPKTREEILATQTRLPRKAKANSRSQSITPAASRQSYFADFAIYGANSFVQDDYDGDGFYQTFSVTFDADIYSYTENQLAEVYALLYISKNGGPWTHYFTTDNFLIEGDTDLDEYEVITTLRSGYSSDYYDVLIDLYQVGYSDIVASYSADDSNALYALPLESAEYDEPYLEVVEVSGGNMYWGILLLIVTYFIRLKIRAS
ncbi:MAG: choice-of-anchor H family protein [Colwellia sp.]|nr:choice-of-anchor H family protein [Colwellia sp.]MCW8863779.1 choice-of-anchor H family protein [Colwellia sp.]MCW9081960.1 choice-of-anchor H family protein [Colwellia sp.]